jgi:ferric-dicitrate binding protein FerR (iron transport regulator)
LADQNGYIVDDDLLVKHLTGQTLPAEAAAVAEWLVEPDHYAHYDDLRLVWQLTSPQPVARLVDPDQAWGKFKQRLPQTGPATEEAPPSPQPPPAQELPPPTLGGKVVPLRPPARPLPAGWWKVAATLALLAVVSYGLQRWYTPGPPEVAEFAATARPAEHRLPDSSRVVLNRGSQLSFTRQPRRPGRAVELTGEAYFEVRPDAENPFVIQANGTQVRVTGTAFNVKALAGAPTVRVSVREGRVEFTAGSQTVTLGANQTAVFDATTGQLQPSEAPAGEANQLAYALKVLEFARTPLSQALADVEAAYGVKVNLANPALANCQLTVRFDDRPLAEVLQIMAETLGATAREVDGQWVLEGPGCP